MAVKRCLGIDLGSSSVKVAEIALERDKMRIINLVSQDLETPLDASESEKEDAKLNALRALRQKYKITTREAVFSVPGQAVFVRKVKLPATSEDRLARIITYEARQQIPFPVEKTELQYQIFREEGAEEVDVLLVAIRKDHLQEYMRVVNKTGLKPIGLNVSSFALYNYFSFDPSQLHALKKPGKKAKSKSGPTFSLKLPSLKKKKEGKTEEAEKQQLKEEAPEEMEEPVFEEVKGYVNIGAGMLDIAVAKVGKTFELGFTRSVPMAGNEITRVIWDKLSLENLQEAERIKREQVRISLTEEGESAPNYNKEASEAALLIIDRLVSEIKRSLDFYVSQPDGMTVDMVLLSGGQAVIPNLALYMEERLGIPVEVPGGFSEDAFIFPHEEIENISSFVTAIGLALGGLGLARIHVDFLPAEIKVLQEFKAKNLVVGMIAAMLGAIILLGSMAGKHYIEVATMEISDFEPLKSRLGDINEQYGSIVEKRNALQPLLKKVGKLTWENRGFWLDFMLDVKKEMPLGMMFDYLIMGSYGDVIITGRAKRRDSPSELAERLKVFTNIDEALVYKLSKPTYYPDLDEQFHSFEIRLKCKNKFSMIATPTPTPTPTRRTGRRGYKTDDYYYY